MSLQYGLKKETLKKIKEVFARYEQVKEVVIYGSRAKGNYKTGSDIDLTLKGQDLDLKIMNRVSLDLDDLLLPYTFDLSIFNHISNPEFLDHIERIGQVFYCRCNVK
jgi:predicted nucleotidyltransferase